MVQQKWGVGQRSEQGDEASLYIKVFKEILSYSHEIYNINDWSFFLVRKFISFSKKNLVIYIKPSKSNYQLKMQEKCKNHENSIFDLWYLQIHGFKKSEKIQGNPE